MRENNLDTNMSVCDYLLKTRNEHFGSLCEIQISNAINLR